MVHLYKDNMLNGQLLICSIQDSYVKFNISFYSSSKACALK